MKLKLANFRCHEQKEVDFGDKGIVLLTGASGAGKCLAKNTPVKMYDHSIKLVQHVESGDKLMGPDVFPRLVSGLVTGKDNLFKIQPKYGHSYIVNSEHVLTVKVSGKIIDVSLKDILPINYISDLGSLKIKYCCFHHVVSESVLSVEEKEHRRMFIKDLIGNKNSFSMNFKHSELLVTHLNSLGVCTFVKNGKCQIYREADKHNPITISFHGVGEYFGFEVNEDGRFLLGNNTLTHNSSLMMATNFAMYGTGNKLVTYGKRSCEVNFEMEGLKIKRTKVPNRLVVEKDDEIFEDAVGQDVIKRIFNSRFDMLGYMAQNMKSNFLLLSPTDKLTFLEEIVFDKINLTEIKSKCKNMHSKTKEKLSFLEGETQLLKRQIDAMPNVEKTDKPETDLSLKELKHIFENRNNTWENLQTVKMMINKLEELDLTSAEEKIKKATKKLEKSVYNPKEHEKILEQKGKICLFKKEKERVKTITEEMNSLEEKLEERKKLTAWLDEFDVGLFGFNDNFKELREIDSEMENIDVEKLNNIKLGKRYNCPSCQEVLALRKDGLIKAPALIGTETPSDKQVKEAIQKLARFEHLSERRKIIKKELENCNHPFETIKRQIQEHDKAKFKLGELPRKNKSKNRIEEIKREILNHKNNYEEEFDEKTIYEKLEVFTHQKMEHQTLEKNLSKKRAEFKELEKRRKDLSEKLALQKTVEELERHVKLGDLYHDYLKYLEGEKKLQMKSNLEKGEMKREKLIQKLEALTVLKSCIEKSESDCITSTIDQINFRMEKYLDKFFEDESINVTFKVQRESKGKGMIQPHIYHKGNEAVLASLSGGELSRVVLATSLALADLFDSPMILLDESTSNLDAELTEKIIDSIRDFFPDKLVVLIAHQVVKGTFDRVIHC